MNMDLLPSVKNILFWRPTCSSVSVSLVVHLHSLYSILSCLYMCCHPGRSLMGLFWGTRVSRYYLLLVLNYNLFLSSIFQMKRSDAKISAKTQVALVTYVVVNFQQNVTAGFLDALTVSLSISNVSVTSTLSYSTKISLN